MTITVRYSGHRAYAEVTHKGVRYGFSPQQVRDDLPADLVQHLTHPGFTQWVVEGMAAPAADRTAEMKAVVESAPEPVADEVEPEPTVEEAVEEDSFDASMTRAQMMAWCKEHGIEVTTSDTKAILTEKAQEYLGA